VPNRDELAALSALRAGQAFRDEEEDEREHPAQDANAEFVSPAGRGYVATGVRLEGPLFRTDASIAEVQGGVGEPPQISAAEMQEIRAEQMLLRPGPAPAQVMADRLGVPVVFEGRQYRPGTAVHTEIIDASDPAQQHLVSALLRTPRQPRVFTQSDDGTMRDVGETVFGIDFAPVGGEDRTTRVEMTRDENGVATVQRIEHVPTTRALQTPLLPVTRPNPRDMLIPVNLLDIAPGTPEPGADLLNSIETLGFYSAITVREVGPGSHGRFQVWGGRRRSLAAREVGLRMVPAQVYPAETPDEVMAAISMTENAVRSENPLGELQAIETMMQRGLSESDIARELMIPIRLVRRRIGLARLIPQLRTGLADGRIYPNVAELASRLTNEQQLQLASILNERYGLEGRARNLRAADVRNVRSAGLQGGAQGEIAVEGTGEAGDLQWVQAAIQDRAADDGRITHISVGNEMFVREDFYLRERLAWTLPDGREFHFMHLNADGTPRDQFIVGDQRFLPEVWMREQIVLSRAAVEVIDEGQIRYHNQLYMSADRAEAAVRSGVEMAVNTFGANDTLMISGRRFVREDVAMQMANDTVAAQTGDPSTDDITLRNVVGERDQAMNRVRELEARLAEATNEEESWANVYRLLQRAELNMPVAPDPAHEGAFHAIAVLQETAQRLAQAEARQANAAANPIATAVIADAVLGSHDRAGAMTLEAMAATLMIRGGYRQFEREPGTNGRWFERYVDSNDRLRRRTLNANVWENRVRTAYAVQQRNGAPV
jgi:ParB/RepB/Spo0J family partition protein